MQALEANLAKVQMYNLEGDMWLLGGHIPLALQTRRPVGMGLARGKPGQALQKHRCRAGAAATHV